MAESENTANLRFLSAELREFATGMRALDQNRLDQAEAASARMDAGLWRAQQDAALAKKDKPTDAKKDTAPMEPVSPDALSKPLVKTLGVASMELRAGVLGGAGQAGCGQGAVRGSAEG